jgi:hypothetical protein
MSADFVILVLCAVFSAYGAHAAIRENVKWTPTVLAVALFAFVGIHTVFLAIMTGDGRVLPGLQLSPDLKAAWGEALADSVFPAPGFCLLALLAHGLVLAPRIDRAHALRPLPVTLLFVVLFFVLGKRTEQDAMRYEQVQGPDEVAYLTVTPIGPGRETRLVISTGGRDDAFMTVRHVHVAESAPPKARLFWTNDGKGVVFQVQRLKPFAIDLESDETIGRLAERHHEWPREVPGAQSREAADRLALDRKAVDAFVKRRGGLFIR